MLNYGFEGQRKHSNPVQGDLVRERPLDFQGVGLGFSDWPEYFFPIYYEPDFFFHAIVGQNIFSIQYKFGSNFIVTNRLQNYCIEVVCLSVCLCVCVSVRNYFNVACQFQIHCNTTLYEGRYPLS